MISKEFIYTFVPKLYGLEQIVLAKNITFAVVEPPMTEYASTLDNIVFFGTPINLNWTLPSEIFNLFGCSYS
jgi:hypothetical protein